MQGGQVGRALLEQGLDLLLCTGELQLEALQVVWQPRPRGHLGLRALAPLLLLLLLLLL
jgi:hypothetical protein